MTGKTISHYKILEKLGEGGMGVIYKAEDTKLKRTVALKFLPQDLTRDEKSRKRFMHEAQAASALDHPNIGTIYEVDQTEAGQMFIAMACYEGESLKDKIEHGPLPLDFAIDIASQIAKGFSKAHSKEIIHRDIKPANILIAEDDQVKIVDFGLAKLADRTRLTKSGITLGTPAYMSPEQTQGEEADHHTDLWALGVVLYEMVTGKQPFQGDYEQAVMYSIMNEEPEPLTGLRTGVPMELERIVNKCLQKQPSDRYQHADELLVDLRQCHKSSGKVQTSTVSEVASKRYWFIGTTLTVFAVMLILYFSGIFSAGTKDSTSERIMLVVLPFENLGDPEDAYFADGISDEILTKLATISELGVIARESSFKYRGDEKSIAEMGKELGVQYILRGAIRWQYKPEGISQVRITPRLVSVTDNTSIWANAFDEKLEEIFSVQASIAEKVSQALNITLVQTSRQALKKKPTQSIEAYQYFVRAKEVHFSSSQWKERLENAEELYKKSVELDSNFVLAYAWLSILNTSYYFYVDRNEDRLVRAKEFFERALYIDSNLPQAYLAQGRYLYQGERNFQAAYRVLEKFNKLNPSNWYAIFTLGSIRRRQGYFDEAIRFYKMAKHLNPGAYEPVFQLGLTYGQIRKYNESESAYKQVISLWPEYRQSYINLAYLYTIMEGNTLKARQVLETASDRFDPEKLNGLRLRIYTLEGNFEKALEGITFSLGDSLHYYLSKAYLYHHLNRVTEMNTYADSARALLEKKVLSIPDNSQWHKDLGLIYAFLNRKEKAIAAGKKAVELRPVSKDALSGPVHLNSLAQIYVLVGEYDAAIDQLEYLLSIPSSVTIPLLKIDPAWVPLREHPRFQKLIGEEGMSRK